MAGIPCGWPIPVPLRRGDAEARPGRFRLRSFPVLQTHHPQGAHRAHLHDRPQAGEPWDAGRSRIRSGSGAVEMPHLEQSHGWLRSRHLGTSPSSHVPGRFQPWFSGNVLRECFPEGSVSPGVWELFFLGKYRLDRGFAGSKSSCAGQGWGEDAIPGSLLQPALPKFPPCAPRFPAIRVFVPSVGEGIIPTCPGSGFPDPIALLLPRSQSETYQEDIYPMTPGTEPALTPDEWLSGVNRGKATRGGGIPKISGMWDGAASR